MWIDADFIEAVSHPFCLIIIESSVFSSATLCKYYTQQPFIIKQQPPHPHPPPSSPTPNLCQYYTAIVYQAAPLLPSQELCKYYTATVYRTAPPPPQPPPKKCTQQQYIKQPSTPSPRIVQVLHRNSCPVNPAPALHPSLKNWQPKSDELTVCFIFFNGAFCCSYWNLVACELAV